MKCPYRKGKNLYLKQTFPVENMGTEIAKRELNICVSVDCPIKRLKKFLKGGE